MKASESKRPSQYEELNFTRPDHCPDNVWQMAEGCGERIYLAGRQSPLGELATINSDGLTVGSFVAVSVLAWLSATGLITATVNGKSYEEVIGLRRGARA